MELTSPAFAPNTTIPLKYTQFADNINPPLQIIGVPQGAASLALVMDDPDVPAMAGVPVWDHWVVFNIDPRITQIPEAWEVQGVRGVGTRKLLTYSGPRPPDREHRYFFKLYALDCLLDLPEGATKQEVEAAMQHHVLASAELIGRCAPQIV